MNSLPVKAKSILATLGGVEKAIQYLGEYGNFSSFSNCGRKTDLQLQEFLKQMILVGAAKTKIYCIPQQQNDYLKILNSYFRLKTNCSVRTNNILANLESQAGFETSLEAKIAYLKKFFLLPFDYCLIRNAGTKTVQQLHDIRREIVGIVNNQENDLNEVDKEQIILQEHLEETVCETDAKAKDQNAFEIYRLLQNSLSIEEIQSKLDKPENAAIEFLIRLTLNSSQKPLHKYFIQHYYFREDFLDLNRLAIILNCTNERLRQLNIRTIEFIKNKYWPLLKPLVQFDYTKQFIVVKNEVDQLDYSSSDADSKLFPNLKLFRIIYGIVYSESHIDLMEFFENKKNNSQSFFFEAGDIWMNKRLAHENMLRDFFKWIDKEIFNFESEKFDYNLEILIKRFFYELDIKVSEQITKACYTIIKNIKRTNWDERAISLSKISKKEYVNSILSHCKNFLIETGRPVNTKEFVKVLQAASIDIATHTLLYFLNRKGNQFVRLGNNLWQLADRVDSSYVKGSLRDIIFNFLSQKEEPIHISEIIAYIQQFRKIDERNLLTNLQLEEGKRFEFFNCMFIGIRAKSYDIKWYNLPKVIGGHVSESLIRKAKEYNNNNPGEYFECKFNYPSIHINYLLQKKGFL